MIVMMSTSPFISSVVVVGFPDGSPFDFVYELGLGHEDSKLTECER